MARRTGKNFFAGLKTGQFIDAMPRSNGDFVTQNINQLKNASVPSMELVWHKLGFKEIRKAGQVGHYVKWQKPPHWFMTAHHEPNDYTNVISFYNGVRIQLIGLNSKNAARGGTSDWMFIDEAGFINAEVLQTSVRPRLSGPFANYPNNPLHRNLLIITSAPDTQKGYWVYDYKTKAEAQPDKYYYDTATIYDNSKVIGIEFIEELKSETPGHIWDLEYMNIVDAKPQQSYYPSFDNGHLYQVDGYYRDPYYATDEPLSISFDFNAGFECCLVAQKKPKKMIVLKEFWRADLDKVVDDVCDYYEDHKYKQIHIYGDVTGNHRRSGGNQKLTFDNIRTLFYERGWTPIQETKAKKQPNHEPRYRLIHRILSEDRDNFPIIRINEDECPHLVRAMKMTPVKNNYEKDKSSERDKENPEYATHLPDAFDYLIWYPYKSYLKLSGINYSTMLG